MSSESNSRLLQLNLLSQMRARDRVAKALDDLTSNHEAMRAARTQLLEIGLDQPGHSVELYRELLGPGRELPLHADVPGGAVERLGYQLPLWDRLTLVVYGDARGRTLGVWFERLGGALDSRAMESLEIWEIVEGDLAVAGWPCRVVDEWYPMKDFECRAPQGKQLNLCFDLGLLQRVERGP